MSFPALTVPRKPQIQLMYRESTKVIDKGNRVKKSPRVVHYTATSGSSSPHQKKPRVVGQGKPVTIVELNSESLSGNLNIDVPQ